MHVLKIQAKLLTNNLQDHKMQIIFWKETGATNRKYWIDRLQGMVCWSRTKMSCEPWEICAGKKNKYFCATLPCIFYETKKARGNFFVLSDLAHRFLFTFITFSSFKTI